MKRHCWQTKSCVITLALLLLICGCTQDDGRSPLFQDGFENSHSGWGEDEGEKFGRGYEEDEYFVELYEPNWFAWAYPGKRFDDVNVEVDAYLASGSQDGHFGLLCRHVNPDNFYYFAISADGYYAIFRRVDGDLEVLTASGGGMAFSPAIRTGGQTNRILAVCQGEELSLYVNGELLETVADDTHARGDVGIGAGSGPGGAVRIQFDDFSVTRP